MSKWQEILSVESLPKAEIMKARLFQSDILCHLISKKDNAYLFGTYVLMVQQDDVLNALRILKED